MSDQKNSIFIEKLDRYYVSPNKYKEYISNQLPKNTNMTLQEKIEYYGSVRCFRIAWYNIYLRNEAKIEAFVMGDLTYVDKIDFNILVPLVRLVWSDIDLYDHHKELCDYVMHDYLNIANRLLAIKVFMAHGHI